MTFLSFYFLSINYTTYYFKFQTIYLKVLFEIRKLIINPIEAIAIFYLARNIQYFMLSKCHEYNE